MDNYKRQLFIKNELKKIFLKSIKKNKNIKFYKRYLANYYISLLPRNKSITNISNRCIYTGRVWGTNRFTKTSRFKLRTLVYKSYLPGFRRASW